MPHKILPKPSTSNLPCPKYSWHAKLASDSRSPCPALNTLANHGYIPRSGRNLTFFQLARATALVYNLSYPLAIFLTLAGFATCGKLTAKPKPTPQQITNPHLPYQSHTTTPAEPQKTSWTGTLLSPITSAYNLITSRVNALWWWSWSLKPTLNLSDLSARGSFKIAHDASLVHPSYCPSTAPDADLLADLLAQSQSYNPHPGSGCAVGKRHTKNSNGNANPRNSGIPSKGKCTNGLTLIDLAEIHEARVRADPQPLGNVHQQIALGECALTWLILRGDGGDKDLSRWSSSRKEGGSTLGPNPTSPYAKMGTGSKLAKENVSTGDYHEPIPTERLEQWFGEERLPDGWWSGVRPSTVVGLFQARRVANAVGKLSASSA